MKNGRGITIMNLVITIAIMIVLISIAGYYSIDSVKNSYTANRKKELADVVQYTSILKTKLLMEEFYPTSDTVIKNELLYTIGSSLTESEQNKIVEVNSYEGLTPNYKYHYITPEYLKDRKISNNAIVEEAEYNYIINFYTGTVIELYDSNKKSEIVGRIKSLNDILNEARNYSLKQSIYILCIKRG